MIETVCFLSSVINPNKQRKNDMILQPSEFGSTAIALMQAVKEAQRLGDPLISIPRGEYHIYADEAVAPVVCASNHGFNGFKSAAIAIEETHGLTVDGNGSRFLLHGKMDFAVIQRSSDITLRNFSVTCADTCNFQGRVIRSEDGTVEILLEDAPSLLVCGRRLYEEIDGTPVLLTRVLDYMTETGELRRGTGDLCLGATIHELEKALDGDRLTLYDVPTPPPVGDTLVFAVSHRCNQAFLADHSERIAFEDISVNTCFGMGFLSQKCRDVRIERCTICPERGRYWSAGQDATHFVNCSGNVTVKDCRFSNQLDDAVNLHGIYTVVERAAKDRLLVRYGHFQSRGVDIYAAGDRIQWLERETQQPQGSATVAAVEVLNPDLTILTLRDADGEVREGMIVENLTDLVDAHIVGNDMRNNRARGMLIAAKGTVEIARNTIHTGGAAIQFESDPIKWLESGGTQNVIIRENRFADCKYGAWGQAVIDVEKRRRGVEGFYYHERIEICDNEFTQEGVPCVYANSVADLIFSNNRFVCAEPLRISHVVLNGETVETYEKM